MFKIINKSIRITYSGQHYFKSGNFKNIRAFLSSSTSNFTSNSSIEAEASKEAKALLNNFKESNIEYDNNHGVNYKYEEEIDEDFEEEILLMNNTEKSKLYHHLLNFSRINGRNVQYMPKWAQISREDVLNLRSSKQLKRALEKPIFAPIMFEDNKRYRRREVGWVKKEFRKINTPNNLKLYGSEESIAYTKYILPGRYSQTRRVLNEISRLRPTWSPKSIIDFGCGPGTSLIAGSEIWNNSVRKYVGVDMSSSMLDIAKKMANNMDNKNINSTFWLDTAGIVQRVNRLNERFDLAIIGFTLSELVDDQMRIAAVDLFYNMLSNDGHLVLIENGSPKGSHMIRSARQYILDNNLEADILAPCTHKKECPLRHDAWCSFSQFVPKDSIVNDKYSYVVISKKIKKISRLPSSSSSTDVVGNENKSILSIYKSALEKNPNVSSVDQMGLGPNEDEKLNEASKFIDNSEWARIIRSPLKSKSIITTDVCSPNGSLDRIQFSKSTVSPHSTTNMFGVIRRSTWGGLLPAKPSPLNAANTTPSPFGTTSLENANNLPSGPIRKDTSERYQSKKSSRQSHIITSTPKQVSKRSNVEFINSKANVVASPPKQRGRKKSNMILKMAEKRLGEK